MSKSLQRHPLFLAVSLDVEEEGLFCGRYAQKDVGVTNTQALPKLRPLLRLGVRPTLFCAYSVFTDPASCQQIKALHEEAGAEIAAHLHHWNTPPLTLRNNGAPLTSVPSAALRDADFSAKLTSVLEAGKSVNGSAITSFRMGRWDIHRSHWELLSRAGILTDASVRPLHGKKSGSHNPDHFNAPSHPYWIPTRHGHIFEVPLTVTPIFTTLSSVLNYGHKAPRFIETCTDFLKSTTNYWGALALLPAYHPLIAMQAVTRLYIARGGSLLSLTWHSSEMQAGATPHLPTERHVTKLLAKVEAYVCWLKRSFDVQCLPMNELRNTLGRSAPRLTAEVGDYTLCARPA